MRCLVRKQVKGAWQEQAIETDGLSIGRSSQNLIELPGLLVSPLHARIVADGPGRYRIQSSALAGVEVNEVVGIRDTSIKPGDVIGVGEHRLRIVEPRSGADLVIEIELGDPGSAFARTGSRTELMQAGLRQRRPALILAALVLLLGFVVPLLAAIFNPPDKPVGEAPLHGLWLTQPVSRAHAHFGQDCVQCHEKPFMRVRDDACMSCHAGIAHHSDTASIRELHGFQMRCASCHDEHAGKANMITRAPQMCTDCHASPAFADFADLAAAGDFEKLHPPFRPLVTVALDDGSRGRQKMTQTAELRDYGGLVFPHDLHLSPDGVRGPDGDQVMQCADCHVPGTGRIGFGEVRYDAHCASCHRLDTVFADQALELPHGSSESVWNLLSTLGANVRAASAFRIEDSGRRLPGAAADRGGPMTVEEQLADIFERRVCAKCHETERNAENNRPQVRPVSLPKSWFTHATFTHASHEWVGCDRCHAAADAKSGEVLMLPDLASCRECHGGVASADKVQSTCIDCHRLHRATMPWRVDAAGAAGGHARAEFREDQQTPVR